MHSTEVLLFLSVIPTIVLGIYIYQKDKIEKEPISLLIRLFFFGIFSTVITFFLSKATDFIIPPLYDSSNKNILLIFIDSFIKVALIEEFSKWFLLKISTWKNKEFNYIYDAVVYACFISLGFATIENILYVFDGGISVALLRALLSVPGHAFFGVFMGYYYGLSKQAYINKNFSLYRKNLILSLVFPILLHGIFDFCLSYENILILGIYLIFVIWLYIQAFKKVKQLSNISTSLDNFSTSNHQLLIPITNKYCDYCHHVVDGNFCSNCGKPTNNH